MKNKALSCWDLKIKLESLEDFDFYVDMVYGNVKQSRPDACVIYSGHKNKALDFVYGSYNDNGEYYISTLEETKEDIEIDGVPEEEILKHYFELKKTLNI